LSIVHVVSVSGGKDSAATLLLAIARFGKHRVRAIFCDTGNEHVAVYDYLDYLEAATGITIVRLKADFSAEIAAKRMFIARDNRHQRVNGRRLRWSNKAKRRALAILHPTGIPFLDVCLWKGRFPSRMAQFCTQHLKRDLAVQYQLSLVDAGYTVVSWQGVRRDESISRRAAKRYEYLGAGLHVYRPLVDWSAQEVFAWCKTCGIEPNPLYRQGMSRVGCMPCVNVSKGELKEIGLRFPEHIARIAAWERLVSSAAKRGYSTMLHKGPGETRDGDTDQAIFAKANIHQMVRWSQTAHGGRQFSLLTALHDASACSSSYGLCE
jgi:3'-phosphoadenosine 5'-phosphosulfate sulfotransferase (PAPS reductase)/FAD synthetase